MTSIFTRAARHLVQVLLVFSVTAALAADEDQGGASASITWLGYNEALAQARDLDKPVFIHFTASWCKWCVKMKKETYADPDVARYMMANFVPVIVDTEKLPSLAKKYGVSSLPTLWFLSSDAKPLTAVPGFVEAENFLLILEYISTKAYEEVAYDHWKRRRTKH